MIEYTHSLVAAQRPIDYYSVFISYSSTDEAIAQRLHTDLQAAGVRCWFADLEIGAPIVRGIDAAIRIYDKLLILSDASVKSNWVEFEVNQALHREIEQGRTMLFPIRLDDAVLHTRAAGRRISAPATSATSEVGRNTIATRRRSRGRSGISRRRTTPGRRLTGRASSEPPSQHLFTRPRSSILRSPTADRPLSPSHPESPTRAASSPVALTPRAAPP
jgi:hypothetical protein